MRIQSYLLLLLAFACGIAGSFLVAATFFWAKPNASKKVDNRPRTEVIVAKHDIQVGSRLDASMIRYQSAVIDEVPDRAIFNFGALNGKKTIYTIPEGCPICEEMLADFQTQETESKAFIPPGYRVVPIQVEKVHGSAASFVPGSQADITVIPHQRSGSLIEKKNAVLGITPAESREVVFEKVSVFSVRSIVADASQNASGVAQVEEVTVLLTPAQLETLTRQSRQGMLRLSPVVDQPEPLPNFNEAIAKQPVLEEVASVPLPPTAPPTTVAAVPELPVAAPVVVRQTQPILPEVRPILPESKPLPINPVESKNVQFAETVPAMEMPVSEPVRPSGTVSFVVPRAVPSPSPAGVSAVGAKGVANRPFEGNNGTNATSQEMPMFRPRHATAEPNAAAPASFNPFNMGAGRTSSRHADMPMTRQ